MYYWLEKGKLLFFRKPFSTNSLNLANCNCHHRNQY